MYYMVFLISSNAFLILALIAPPALGLRVRASSKISVTFARLDSLPCITLD